MQYALFVIALVAELITGRTHLLAIRGGMPAQSGVISTLIGIAAGLCFFALLIWAFATFRWYVALLTIVGVAFTGGSVVTASSWAFWYRCRAIVDFVAVAATVSLFWVYWPF